MQLSFNRGSRAVPSPAGMQVSDAPTLVDLREGQSAVIDEIDLPKDLAHRLMELGFLPGAVVEAARSAPGGDPRVFRVDGTEVALRRETASRLILRP